MSAALFRSLVILPVLLGGSSFAAEKPNILFIFADDLAYDCVGAHGNQEVQTPHLDDIAKDGVVFTHAYNMGGWHGAVCVASRTMLNTGRFLWRAKQAETDIQRKYVAQKKMWSQIMEANGYQTFMTGKWHVKAKAEAIFQTAAHVRGGMPKQTPQGYNRPLGPDDKTWQPWDPKFGGFWEGGKHWSEVVADDAEDFLQVAAKTPEPFFMYIAFNAPHDPRQAPREFVERYPLEKISVPQPFIEDYPYQIGCNRIRDEKLAPFPRTEYAVKVNRQEYYAIITHMDEQIGRIMSALQKTGQADNTYVIFTADHGLGCGHHGLMGKQNMYDHSVRVPFFITGPNIPASQRNAASIYLQDAMATTLELAGIAKPKHVEFRSVLPLIRGEQDQHYQSIYGAYVNYQRMITRDGYKLIVYPQIGKRRLFHIAKDPLELHDLIADPTQQDRVADLMQQLTQLQREMGDELTLEPQGKAPRRKVKKKAA